MENGIKPARRLSPELRERLILDAAIDFFAEKGPDGLVRDLANSIGISQGLIFRYFGTKENLVDRVYEVVCFTRWDPNWEKEIGDGTVYIGDRLRNFFRSYILVADNYHWIRISMYLALTENELKKKYVNAYITSLINNIAREVKKFRGFSNSEYLTEIDREEIWQIHSAIIHYAVRRHIHNSNIAMDRNQYVDMLIDRFIVYLETTKGIATK
jgi:AcrR family transcriptional regulator